MINWFIGAGMGFAAAYTITRAMEAKANGVPVSLALTNPFTPVRLLAVVPAATAAAKELQANQGPGHFSGLGYVWNNRQRADLGYAWNMRHRGAY
jgi:hypothetical protein